MFTLGLIDNALPPISWPTWQYNTSTFDSWQLIVSYQAQAGGDWGPFEA